MNEASGWFRSALRVVPWDPICLASLAVCLSLLKRASKSNKKSKDRRINRDKIRSKLSNLSDYGVLINSKDSDELFEASITGNLSTIVAKNLKKSRTNANSESTRNSDICDRSPNLNITYEESDNGLSNKVNSLDSYSIPPDVYVWYGVYELQKINSNSLVMLNPIPSYIHHFNEARPNSDFISDGLLKAKVLFEAASRRYQSVLNPLATFMIGWVIEIEGDLPLAEQYYNNALSCNPEKNILCYYRMIATLEKKYRAVKRLLAKHEKLSLNKAGSKNNKLQMKEKLSLDPFLAIFDPTTTNNFEDGYYPTQRIPRMLMDSDDESNDCNNNDSSRNIDHVRKRWLLHQRIYETAQLKKSHFKFLFKKFESFNLDDSSNKSSNCGNTAQNIGSNIYFYLEEDWVDRYLHAFGKCEDWAWLLRSCSTYPQQVSPIGLTSTNIKPVFSKRGIYQYKNDKNNSIGSSGSPKSNSNSKPGISTDTIGETIKIVNILSTTKLKTLEKVNKSEKKTSKKKKKKTKEM